MLDDFSLDYPKLQYYGTVHTARVCHEENNKYDSCAMAVYREHGLGNERINVGHIPIELSSTLRFFVEHGGNISAKVRQKNYRASNLEQGALEVSIIVQCANSSQKGQLMKRLKQLIKKCWRDPRNSYNSEHYNTRKKVRQQYNTNTDTLLYFILLCSNYPSYVTPVFFL